MYFYFFALSAHGKGISGGDRIFIELARRWSKSNNVVLYITPEGKAMCGRNSLKPFRSKKGSLIFNVVKNGQLGKFGFFADYIIRILLGIKLGLKEHTKEGVVYSASDFWMDVLPALLVKLRSRRIKWLASWFQTAPNPLRGYSEGRYKLSAFLYFFSQLPVRPLISQFADYVFVNNESELKIFPGLNFKKRAFVFIGAIDTVKINKWKKKHKKNGKVYEAVYQGRFHPQKGVVELLDIWKSVVRKRPDAKLAMIGDGPLMPEVKKQINQLKLTDNVFLFGYVFDGDTKYNIFLKSKIVVHPAFYDSGGMAAAEAMAFGLPAVGFDLPAYKSYYPKGMIKVPKGDRSKFSRAILKLLSNPSLYKKITREGNEMIESNWSWDLRAENALRFVK